MTQVKFFICVFCELHCKNKTFHFLLCEGIINKRLRPNRKCFKVNSYVKGRMGKAAGLEMVRTLLKLQKNTLTNLSPKTYISISERTVLLGTNIM